MISDAIIFLHLNAGGIYLNLLHHNIKHLIEFIRIAVILVGAGG